MYNKLTAHDKAMIEDYIELYGPGYDYTEYVRGGRPAPLDYRLRFWSEAKSKYLAKMFNGELILRKEIEYTKEYGQMQREVSDLIYDRDWKWKRKLFCTLENANSYLADESKPQACWDTGFNGYMNYLIQISNLIDNKYSDTCPRFVVINPNKPDKHKVVVEAGCKPLKAIRKILELIFEDTFDFDEFRIKHSQILNQKVLRGTLCLSIHPMDYMTISDNACGWSSCMGWMPEDGDPEPGCYRRGTVEMMNSPCVVVAYLESSSALELNELANPTTWNSKKWRTLAVVTPEIITTIKDYPYENSILCLAVVEWLRALATAHLGWDYGTEPARVWDYEDEQSFPYCPSRFTFTTVDMYNDFGCSNHYGVAAPNASSITIKYSGKASCMHCGELNYFGDTKMVYCLECIDLVYCNSCEDSGSPDYMIQFDGVWLCPDCFDQETTICALSEERVWNSEAQNIYLVPDKYEGGMAALDFNQCYHLHISEYTQNSPLWSKYFKVEEPHGFHKGWHYYAFVYLKECTDLAIERYRDEGDYCYYYNDFDEFYNIKEEEDEDDAE